MKKIKKSFLVKEDVPKKFNTLNVISAMMLIGLLTLFVISIGYAIKDLVKDVSNVDYILALVKRILITILILVPVILKRVLGISFPILAVISFYLFIFLSVYIGELTNLYEFTSLYNKFVHGFCGFLLAFLSIFCLSKHAANYTKKVSPLFVFIFACMFSIALGVCWEILEFIFDSIFNNNMQVYQNLVGREILFDTMFDIIANVVGSVIGATICAVYSYKNNDFFNKFKILKIKNKKKDSSEIEEIEE